ncbi:putative sporulation protein YtxC [Natronincola ferrireducens]|uniref:Putative sporulation protein YtxC n=1 Tax=Natronincola ferrireducens TaxID=393762 RepID=A0A1G9EF88_9FIRM|nr:putative sporulation protein YtxC [Natronincola ferrireducens]SDK74774.1 putative sporulation protein YtxC [Natronincola ferrireducens]
MNLLSIITDKNVEKLQQKLNKQINVFENEGILIEEKIIQDDSFYILNYSVEIESVKNYSISDFINIFKYCGANALFEYIKAYEEPHLINKIIDCEYYYFNIKERMEIQNIIRTNIEKENNKAVEVNSEESHRKFTIIQRFMDYFKLHDEINIKGFITFRLKDYILELQDIVERAVEDFLMDKEYNEFIKLLKYFVDIQEAKIDLIHILLEDEGKYKLYDQYGNLVNNEYLKVIASEMGDKDINYEDLLISSLITIAPNKVFIHNISKLENPDMIKTISQVFANKVKVCRDCDWCRVKANAEKE